MTKLLRINTKEGMEEFLRILAEESVTRAYDKLSSGHDDERSYQDEVEVNLKDLKKYQKGEDPKLRDEEDKDVIDKSKKKMGGDTEKAKSEEPPKDVAPQQTSSVDEKITFTMIKDKVNTIRSGRSLRDEKIRGELKDYFNSIDEEEQKALYAFLDGISQILTAGIEGEDADEPSDPPHNIHMHSDDEEDGEISQKSAKQVSPKKTTSKKKLQPKPKTRSLEDTTPPIDVGKKQRTESIRRHIRDLLG